MKYHDAENRKFITNDRVFYKTLFAHFKLFYADFASLLPFINHQARRTNQKLALFYVLLRYPANKARYEQTLLTLLNKECLNYSSHRHEISKLKTLIIREKFLPSCFTAFLPYSATKFISKTLTCFPGEIVSKTLELQMHFVKSLQHAPFPIKLNAN